MDRKILVCITPQSGSKRLINEGSNLSKKINGELHILNVEKGENILATSQSMLMLQKLFTYASALGGTIHGLCGNNVYKTIKNFILENNITDLVLGTPLNNPKFASENFNDKIKNELPFLEIHVIQKRNNE